MKTLKILSLLLFSSTILSSCTPEEMVAEPAKNTIQNEGNIHQNTQASGDDGATVDETDKDG